MRLIITIFLIIQFGFTSVASQSIRKGKDYALFIAVNDYSDSTKSQFTSLRGPIIGARDIATELAKNYAFDTLVLTNPDRRQIDSILTCYQNEKYQPEDQLFIYISGHGVKSSGLPRGEFVPRKGQNFYFGTLADKVSIINCGHVLLTIDACFAGTMITNENRMSSLEDDKRVGDDVCAERKRITKRELANGSKLALTTGDLETTGDDKGSKFSRAILATLQDAYVDNNDGLVTFYELKAALNNKAPGAVSGKLTNHENGRFVFVVEDFCNEVTTTETPESEEIEMKKPVLPSPPKTASPKMVLLPAGTFKMGDTVKDKISEKDEKPVHEVDISSFYLGAQEVSVDQFAEFVDEENYLTDAEKDGGSYKWRSEWVKIAGVNWKCTPDIRGDTCRLRSSSEGNHPVVHVSWRDAIHYCNWLSRRHKMEEVYEIDGETIHLKLTANGYRLPTEAEWEYAARNGGKDIPYAWTEINPHGNVADIAAKYLYPNWRIAENYNDNYPYTAPVGTFKQGDFGLFDITGNVREWCWDIYANYSRGKDESTDSYSSMNGRKRVIRGGAWSLPLETCRNSERYQAHPDYRFDDVGFRVARNND